MTTATRQSTDLPSGIGIYLGLRIERFRIARTGRWYATASEIDSGDLVAQTAAKRSPATADQAIRDLLDQRAQQSRRHQERVTA